MYDDDQGGFDSGSPAPVKVGDELEVSIEAVGAKGDGIAKKEGFVLFVPGVQKGDNVKIKVTRVLRKVGFAEVVSGGSGEEQPSDAPAAEPSEEAPAEETSEKAPADTPAPEETPQDSEDFGEEEKK